MGKATKQLKNRIIKRQLSKDKADKFYSGVALLEDDKTYALEFEGTKLMNGAFLSGKQWKMILLNQNE
jgi:hypothetical protein